MKESPHKLITCVLPKGQAKPVLKALKDERGIIRTSINNARGMGRFSHIKKHSAGQQTEKEILSVVATCDEADDIFTFIYGRAVINRPHGGVMYMQRLAHAMRFSLPDLPEEVSK